MNQKEIDEAFCRFCGMGIQSADEISWLLQPHAEHSLMIHRVCLPYALQNVIFKPHEKKVEQELPVRGEDEKNIDK